MTHRRLLAWLLAAGVLWPTLAFGQTGTLAPNIKYTSLADDGTPCAGCLLYAYISGTTTPQDTFNNVDLAPGHANANPIVLDAAGRATIYLSAASYKFVLTNATGGTTYWTQDNVSANASFTVATDIAGVAGEAIAAGQVVYLSDGSGSKTAGSWYLARSDLAYASSSALAVGMAPSAISSGATGAIRLAGRITGLSGLVAGTAYYVSATPGALTSTPPANTRTVGAADSTTSLVQSALLSGFALLSASNTFTGATNTFNNAIAVAGTATFSGTNSIFNSTVAMNGTTTLAGTSTFSGSNSFTNAANHFTNATGPDAKNYTYNGSTSGSVIVSAPAVAGSGTVTLPSGPLTNFSCGRLTLTTATPVTITDVTAATTLYYSPYGCNLISLYDGSTTWTPRAFVEISIAVPATTSTVYDVWVFDSAGVATLELLAWTNDTTRATALTLQNGVLVKTGATTRKYVGSFRTTTVSGQTEDSFAKRYVWNNYNRVPRLGRVIEATSTWTYSTGTFRQARATTTNQLDFVIGVADVRLNVMVSSVVSGSAVASKGTVSIGEDSTTTPVTGVFQGSQETDGNGDKNATANYSSYPAVGRHTYVWLEKGSAATETWRGTSNDAVCGIFGEIQG